MICPACSSQTTDQVALVNGYAILTCGNCGLCFASVQPTNDLEDIKYDDLYKEDGLYMQHVREAKQLCAGQSVRVPRAQRAALKQIALMKPASLLEIGCGVGRFLRLAEKQGIDRIYGVDISPNAINLASQHLKRCALHVGHFTADVFKDRLFDVVCMWEVIEHVVEPLTLLQEIFRRLNPGGWVFLSTPNYESSWLWRDLPADPRSAPPVHLTFWTKDSLIRLLRSIGFEYVTVKAFSIPYSAAKRTLREGKGAYFVFLDALIRPSQRATLLGQGRRPF